MIPDPGLQPERTALAWTRAVLALIVNAALLVRTPLLQAGAVSWVGCAALCAAAIILLSVAQRRGEQLRRRRPGAPRWEVAWVTGCTFVMALAALLQAISW
ncbi:DUF202 domain-containing protein [Acidovorax sp. M2(2025)]|uniref:DUF202 domain-containing protein n=1 Tax=Acidovorax sp. M2(2025) TaxID=3411355 RepID=UPI003BF5E5B6